jgi:hypothetical protein
MNWAARRDVAIVELTKAADKTARPPESGLA